MRVDGIHAVMLLTVHFSRCMYVYVRSWHGWPYIHTYMCIHTCLVLFLLRIVVLQHLISTSHCQLIHLKTGTFLTIDVVVSYTMFRLQSDHLCMVADGNWQVTWCCKSRSFGGKKLCKIFCTPEGNFKINRCKILFQFFGVDYKKFTCSVSYCMH